MNLGAVRTASEMVNEMLMGMTWLEKGSQSGFNMWSMGDSKRMSIGSVTGHL